MIGKEHMGTITQRYVYRCWNDCQPQGCPSHEATLEYQSTSDSLHFKDGKGHEIFMQTPELKAFLCMLQSLGGGRVEIESLIKAAFISRTSTEKGSLAEKTIAPTSFIANSGDPIHQAAEAKYKASLPPGINIR